ncbi:hypothetical protein LTR56_014235 [Elasticomyces elasticus]|nr:hypothetical protein LTR56_014235 [Elasticomyces elasticus]KAK4917400.1 hypothetical protein LTR49_014754 [Elasticomyces elasticus]
MGDISSPQHALRSKDSWASDALSRRVLGRVSATCMTDHLRTWQVRRFCQVKPALVSYATRSTTGKAAGTDIAEGDFALTAILRCVLLELRADLAFISLLDDTTQYFIAGTTSLTDPWVAEASFESTQWYGCDTVLHAGGLCNRTIQLDGPSSIYEEFDMSSEDYTKSLPFVNGEIASFRHYAGVPIVTSDGFAIGTLFTMANEPAKSALSRSQHQFLCDSAAHVMKQLEQAVQALEAQRTAQFSSAIVSLARDTHQPDSERDSSPPRTPKRRTTQSENKSSLDSHYHQAAQLLVDKLDLDEVFLQELPLHGHATNFQGYGPPNGHTDARFLAHVSAHGNHSICEIPPGVLLYLFNHCPDGEMFYKIATSNGVIMTSSRLDRNLKPSLAHSLGSELSTAFPDAQQLLLIPLWDPVHAGVVAVTVGISRGWGRVYTRANDLFPMASFCMSVIQQAHRLEAQHLDRQKADFLGSISHEMRSPLHGTLANIELVLETACTAEQRDMLETALASGRQLLDSIDKVLAYSQISAEPARDTRHDKEQHGTSEGVQPRTATMRDVAESALWKALSRSGMSPRTESRFRRNSKVTHIFPDTKALDGVAEPASPYNHTGLNVVLDVTPMMLPPELDSAALSTVVEELALNALQNTPNGCVRISAQLDTSATLARPYLLLHVADSGKGIPDDFLKHRLFISFSQADQVESGVGLGLSLVKHNVEALGAQIAIESDLSEGTVVSVSIPIALPRDAVAYDHLWNIPLKPWDPTKPPDVVIIPEEHITDFATEHVHIAKVRQLILAPVITSSPPQTVTTLSLFSPFTPTRLAEALSVLLTGTNAPDMCGSPTELPTSTLNADAGHFAERTSSVVDGDAQQHTAQSPEADVGTAPRYSTPSMLLVDDNAINLKVLGTFAKKCGIKEIVMVSSGQDAIDAYKKTIADDSSHGYDVVFMDLSMPTVSGFEATAAIRDLEKQANYARDAEGQSIHASIVALTGLVSAKDRRAAFDAGVDEYVTKPANVKNIAEIIERWKGGNLGPVKDR